MVTDISPLAARVQVTALEVADSGGDIFQATSLVLAIVGAGGRTVVEEAAADLRRRQADGEGNATLTRAVALLQEMLRLRVWICS
jgi:hypothetical protein